MSPSLEVPSVTCRGMYILQSQTKQYYLYSFEISGENICNPDTLLVALVALQN